MTKYVIQSTTCTWPSALPHGIREAVRKAANNDDRGGQLERLERQVSELSEWVGMVLGPLLEHNFITPAEVESQLPYGFRLVEHKPEEEDNG
jgi:hypothetical protein